MDEVSEKLRILLQVLTKRIILDPHGEILEHELNSPFVYLRPLVEGSFTPGNGKGSSEHVPLGGPKGTCSELPSLELGENAV